MFQQDFCDLAVGDVIRIRDEKNESVAVVI